MPAPLPLLRRVAAQNLGGLTATFWWLWTTTLVNRLGGFVVPFLALYLTLDRGCSAAYAGLVISLYGVGAMAADISGGYLADRFGRRAVLILSQLSSAACTAALGLTTGRAAVALVTLLVGLTGNASRPAMSAVLADVVPEQDRTRAFSLNYWAINIGFAVSTAVAGLVAEHGYLLLFLGDAASTLACVVIVHRHIPDTRPEAAPQHRSGPKAGLGPVLRNRRFMALVGLTTAIYLVYQQASTTLAVTMGRNGMTPAQYGLVISVNGLVIVVLQIPLTRLVDRWDRAVVLAVGALLTGAGFGLAAFVSTPVPYAATVVVWSMGEIVLAPAAMAMATRLTPEHSRGRYLGIYTLSFSIAAFAGPLVGGLVLDRCGAAAVWAGCATIGALTAAGYVRLARGHQRSTGGDPAAAPGRTDLLAPPEGMT
jgi:MFS family permease